MKNKSLELIELINEVIRKVPGKRQWILKSKKTGKVLGRHSSKEKAKKQEIAIEIAKHKK